LVLNATGITRREVKSNLVSSFNNDFVIFISWFANDSPFMEHVGLLLYSQEPATDPYPEP
jgi:hypothetical protein